MNKYIWREVKIFLWLAILFGASAYLWGKYKHFQFHGNDLIIECGLILGAILSVWILLIVKNSCSTKKRNYGLELELASFKELRTILPSGWHACHSYKIKQGDIDIVLSKRIFLGLITLKKFAIEIKAWGGLTVQNGQLVKVTDKQIPYGHPALQTLQNAHYIHAIPVLWLPSARKLGTFYFKDDTLFDRILIVNGDAEFLMKVLMKRIKPFNG